MIFRTITDDVTGVNKSIGLFGISLQNVKNKLQEIQNIGFKNAIFNSPTIDIQAIASYNNEISKGTSAQEALAIASRGTNRATIAFMQSANGATISTEQLTSAQKASTLSARALSMAYKAVSIAANMIAFAVISKGIQLAADAIDHYVNRAKYAAEAMEEAQQKIDEAQSKLKSMSDTLSDNKDRFLELSEGVSEFSKNLSLSEEDYQEYLDISNELASIFPSLVSSYDEQGNALLAIGANASETNEKLKEMLETEQKIAQQELINNMGKVAEGVYSEVEQASNEIARLQKEIDNISVKENLSIPKNLIEDVSEGIKGIDYNNLRDVLGSENLDKLVNEIQNSVNSANIDSVFDQIIFAEKDMGVVEKIIKDFYSKLGYLSNNESAAYINGLNKDIKEQENIIKNSYAKMNTNLSAWVQDTYEYDFLDESQKKLVDNLIPKLDWKSIKESTGKTFADSAEYEQYIKENIINPLLSVPDKYQDEINDKLSQLFMFEPNSIEFVNFVQDLQSYLNSLGLEVIIDLTPLLGNTEDVELLQKKYTDAINKFGVKDSKTIEDFFNEKSINTSAEIDKWNEITERAKSAEQAVRMFIEATSENFSKSDMISSINELSEGFEELDKIFSSISDEDPFDFKLLDDKAFKEAFSGLDSYASFIETITSNSDDIEACKTSFNGLIDEWIMSTGVLDNVNESTAQLATSMLNMYGIQNAEEIVQARLKANTDELALSQKYLAETGKELESATDDERLAFLAEQVAAEECGKELALLELKKQLVNGTLLDTQDDINNVLALAEAAGISAEAISVLATAKANFDNAMKSGDAGLIGASVGELERAQQKIKDLIASAGASDYTGGNNSNKSSGGSSSDKWLQEYKDAMSILKDQLDQGLITQTQFYKKSQDLMDKYLKDTPAHVKKYAKEISEAEKDIRNGLTSMFEGIISDLNSDLDNMQSSFSSIANAIEEYNESGALSIDTVQELLKLEPKYLSMLFDENGALQLNQESYERLARAKMEEMKIGLAMEMANTINNLETEAQAIEFVTQMNRELIGSNLSAAESYLQLAVAAAKARSAQTGKVIYSQAADLGLKAYQNQARLIDMTSYSFSSLSGGSSTSSRKEEKEEEKEEDKYSKDFEWIERLLERLSKSTEKITKTIEKYISYVKKNNAINRAVKSIDTEVTQNKNAYDFYMTKAREVDLDADTVRKIQNGSIDAETITDEGLGDKIDEYMEWYDKAQDVKDTIDDLFEQQRDLISQKLDNILSYYSDMDSYLSSITSKVESLISLNDQMGKRSSLTELVEQFANLNKQVISVTTSGEPVEVIKQQIASGTAESVQKAVADEKVKEAERIQKEIDNLNVEQSGTYQKLLKDIEKTEAEIAKYEENGWDITKVKQYDKLQKKVENYYAQLQALDNDATSNTVANYSKVFLAWQKLKDNTTYQKLLDKESEGTLTDKEQAKLDKYNQQLADYEDKMYEIKQQGQAEINSLLSQLSSINETTANVTEAEKIKNQINAIDEELQNSAIYSTLERNIQEAENTMSELYAIGYDNLTKKQKTTYEKLTATLENYYAQKKALDEGATASNIAEYNKIYLAWKKLQDKLDAGKNLSNSEWQKYDSYTKQLENFVNDKAKQYEDLESKLQDALNPPDKQGVIKKEYEESSKQMYDSYQKQIDAINDEVKNTQNYKTLLANIQKLEQKKDTKGLSKSEEDKLKKYQAELEALEKGGTATNVADYMKTWEEWYKLQQKLDNGKKLSTSEASKYDKYKAQLEAWNNEKQTQINDLLSQMEDDLEKLNKTYTENVSEAESEIDEYYANLYNLAKQIAEYNINALEQQLSVIQSMVSYYQNLAGLYETFSGDKLSRLLVDLDEDTALSKLEIYQKELSSLNEQYDVNKKKMKEYQQLLDALDTNNFESSMALFNQVLNDGSVSQATKDNLQQVIDLLNERAVSADNWGEYADQWENEWQQALADAKQSLIEVAGSIQEVNDAIRETSLEPLTDAITQLGYLKNTLSSITGLINDDWIFDEDGELTEYGNAKVSLLVEQMQTARNEADKYAQQIDAIMSMRDTYSSENAYQTALQEAKSNYLSSLNELKGFEDSVVSIMTQSNEAIVNSLKDVISARIKALKAQKDLYEYNKSITNSQKEIDNIKAQIDALENLTGATDAVTKAKLAQLKADLEEKETSLQETKDDHTYNLQIDALEDFMSTLDQTMSDAADAVNKSFAAYKEAIDSALKVYEENKDYLGEWSDTIMKNVLGLANTDGTNTINVDVQQSDSGESQSSVPLIKVENSDTVSAVESQSETLHGDLIDIKTAIEQGIIVKVDNPLTMINPEIMDFVRNYVPPMANAVCTTLPQIAERNGTQTVVNVHYDNLLNVEGNVDKDFANVLPKHLEEAYQYTTKKLYRELNILK